MPRTRSNQGFTLVELLVVIAIIGLLVAIMLPGLQQAKEIAYSVKCKSNMDHVLTAVQMYAGENNMAYPASYLYRASPNGGWRMNDQWVGNAAQFGYLHWSGFLYSGGGLAPDAFQCPAMERGGHPATNPPEDERRDGQSIRGFDEAYRDDQAPRMAYTANGAIIPRNKFANTAVAGSYERNNRFVRADDVEQGAATIAVTEFQEDWRAIAVHEGGSYLSKSHRPVTPFQTVNGYCAGNDVFQLNANFALFKYDRASDIKEWKDVKGVAGLIGGAGTSPLNSVGRHHPGTGQKGGGSTNFGYLDGHCEGKDIVTTVEQKEWGSRFYAITGDNKVHE